MAVVDVVLSLSFSSFSYLGDIPPHIVAQILEQLRRLVSTPFTYYKLNLHFLVGFDVLCTSGCKVTTLNCYAKILNDNNHS